MPSGPKRTLPRMTVDEFIAAAPDALPGERYELVGGLLVAKTREPVAHGRVKVEVRLALGRAIKAAGLRGEMIPGGMAVVVDAETACVPDALVRCGDPLPDNADRVPDPTVVVEVVSPISGGRDRAAKLENYFRIPTVHHYLIVNTRSRRVVHHRRENDAGDDPQIATRILAPGAALDLTPPGLRVEVASLFPA